MGGSGSGPGSGPGRVPASDGRVRGGTGTGPGRRRRERGRTAASAAAASRSRADALMAGGFGGRVARPVVGVVSPSPAAVAGSAGEPGTPGPPAGPRAAMPAAAVAAPSRPGPAEAEAPAASAGLSSAAPGPDAEGRRRGPVLPALWERLPLWFQLRCGLEPRALAALSVVLVAAAVFAAMHLWTARPASVPAPDRVGEAVHAPLAETDAGDGDAAGDTVAGARAPEPSPGTPPVAGPGGQVVVDVSGKVRKPGIHRLPAGARVADALRVAGGARPGVDLDGLNRARVLVDGEQIVVGAPPGPTAAGATGGGAGRTAAPAGPVSLSTATVEQLDTLPGVGPVLAQHIIDYRTQRGGFRSVDELREVNGIGDRRFADLRPLVRP
ncbi:ComEA family DNA-binding protein [Streptomyces sp. NPDC001743]|uniref:ComEA family DNA-binding protein n=1 Tax=Streptomyces sp. NPDC001743 TaxID=3154397 RepID=UPI00332ED6E5